MLRQRRSHASLFQYRSPGVRVCARRSERTGPLSCELLSGAQVSVMVIAIEPNKRVSVVRR